MAFDWPRIQSGSVGYRIDIETSNFRYIEFWCVASNTFCLPFPAFPRACALRWQSTRALMSQISKIVRSVHVPGSIFFLFTVSGWYRTRLSYRYRIEQGISYGHRVELDYRIAIIVSVSVPNLIIVSVSIPNSTIVSVSIPNLIIVSVSYRTRLSYRYRYRTWLSFRYRIELDFRIDVQRSWLRHHAWAARWQKRKRRRWRKKEKRKQQKVYLSY